MTAAAVPDLQLAHVWRGRELAQAPERVLPTGHAALDAELPGRGWPVGCVIEILQAQPQQHVWRLLAPALAQCTAAQPGPVLLVSPPCEPFGPGVQGQGVPADRLLCVHADQPSARLWATEQALRCADVTAVLAWLPRARSEELRRLHLCAQQHDRFLVVLRGVESREHSSPARLRLLVEGVDAMQVRILKRRGPPLLQPLQLPAQHPRLAALLAARRSRGVGLPAALPLASSAAQRGSHVLDRTASLAE